MMNKRIIRFSALFVLIFLLVGLNAVSATDLNDDSLNLTDNLESSTISNAVDVINHNANSEIYVADCSNDNSDMNSNDVIETVDSLKDNSKSKLSASEKTVHTITEANYSEYFDSEGNLINSLVKVNDTINLSGNFSNKKFIINLPLTVTSTESDAFLKNSPIYYTNVANENFQYDASVSNLTIESDLANISAVWVIGSSNIKVFNNDIFTTGHNGYPISLDSFTYSCIVENNKIKTVVPVNVAVNSSSSNEGDDESNESSGDNSSCQQQYYSKQYNQSDI